MRGFSGIAILLYLCLLCTPQAFAVHDPRLSPLADTQLQAISPALQQYLYNTAEQADTDPPALPVATSAPRVNSYNERVLVSHSVSLATVFSVVQPRAPPVFSSH